MRERPILFSGPLVRAILEGRKTQTRRVVTVPWKGATRAPPYEPYYVEEDGRLLVMDEYGSYHPIEERFRPYGAPGDRLWVRETFAVLTGAGHRRVYRADGEPRQAYYPEEPITGMRWTPSIHMPRAASRLTLEVTEVRVERLQAITEEDARAEGLACDPSMPEGTDKRPTNRTCRGSFALLWDSIYAAAPWHQSPWVWVVGFRRLP